jgi:hypothetical protein
MIAGDVAGQYFPLHSGCLAKNLHFGCATQSTPSHSEPSDFAFE